MKKRLTAFIIGAAIWFGMADAARQMDHLQSEASNLIAKSSMFLFSFAGEVAPESTERKMSEPLLIIVSTENALVTQTNKRRVSIEKVTAELTAKAEEKVYNANHSDFGMPETNDIKIRIGDIDGLISMVDDIRRDVHTGSVHSDETASLQGLKEGESKRRAALRRAIASQRVAERAGKRIQGQFFYEYDVKTLPVSVPTQKTLQTCPVPATIEKLKLKTVLLVPEVFREFGE